MAHRSDGEKKRALIFDTALALFREKGFDETTMRDVAKRAGVSLGSAYHYFPSKSAIVVAYYDAQQAQHERLALRAIERSDDLRERLGIAFQTKIEAVRGDRALLVAVSRSLADPADPLSAFSEQSAEVRERAIRVFEKALEVPVIAEDKRRLLALVLWALHLASLAYLVRDESRGQKKTRALIDGGLDLLTPLIAMSQLPTFEPTWARLRQILADAEIIP